MGQSDAKTKKSSSPVEGGAIDFDQLQQIGLGQLGMTEDEFWDTTPRAFFNAVDGYLQLKKEDFELRRLQTFCQVAAWIKIESPQKLWKYSWEEEREKEQLKLEQIEKQREYARKLVHTLRNRS